jgi:Tol biopolymer transport system component
LGGLAQLYVARSDGRGVRMVTPSPLVDLGRYAFSPDGAEVMFQSTMDGVPAISFAKTDGSGIRTLHLGLDAYWPAYRPPHGDEIAFAGAPNGGPLALYTVHADGSGLRTLVALSYADIVGLGWSPDGSRIAYGVTSDDPAIPGMSGARVHVFSLAESTDRVVTPPPDVDWESLPLWSNDGTRLLIWRCHSNPGDPAHCAQSSAVIPADGSGFGVDLDGGLSLGVEGASQGWAPDDKSILTTALDPVRQAKGGSLLWDPATGVSRTAPWAAPGEPSWQRLAP